MNNFGQAIKMLKQGNKVARKGWNGKGMFISMTSGKVLDIEKDDIWTKNIRDVAVSNGGTVELLPYISMKTADNKIQIGWIASQSDVLAEDWVVIE